MNNEMETNIIPSINYIMSSIPDNLTELEKIRYIYIELGKLFSYDYRVIADESIIDEKVDYASEKIGRYKTCYQISEILKTLINGMLPNCRARVVERKINGRSFKREHVATEVITKDGLKLLLDLTLDLSNIQSGMRTKEFGYCTNENGDYDIISQAECKNMDKKLGFITEKYMDDYIEEFKEKINKYDFTNKTKSEIVDYKIGMAKEELFKTFPGSHEAVRYIYNVFNLILNDDELRNLKQYNLSYKNSDSVSIISIYSFSDLNLYYSFSTALGFNKISFNKIQELLKSGWQTNSKSIQGIFKDDDDSLNYRK